MLKKTAFCLFLFLCLVSGLLAQECAPAASPPNSFGINHNFDLAAGFGERQSVYSLSWSHFYGIGTGKRNFRIGYGLRCSIYTGRGKNFTSAPTRLATDESKVDTLFVSGPQMGNVALTLNVKYRLSRFELGFNIDALGLGFGPGVRGKYISSELPVYEEIQSASPTPYSVLLVGTNDIGMLKSEFFISYWLTQDVALRAGLSHIFTEYTTDKKLHYDNDRYRLISNFLFLGITFSPERN